MVHFSMCFLDMRVGKFFFAFIFELRFFHWIRNVCINLCLLIYLAVCYPEGDISPLEELFLPTLKILSAGEPTSILPSVIISYQI